MIMWCRWTMSQPMKELVGTDIRTDTENDGVPVRQASHLTVAFEALGLPSQNSSLFCLCLHYSATLSLSSPRDFGGHPHLQSHHSSSWSFTKTRTEWTERIHSQKQQSHQELLCLWREPPVLMQGMVDLLQPRLFLFSPLWSLSPVHMCLVLPWVSARTIFLLLGSDLFITWLSSWVYLCKLFFQFRLYHVCFKTVFGGLYKKSCLPHDDFDWYSFTENFCDVSYSPVAFCLSFTCWFRGEKVSLVQYTKVIYLCYWQTDMRTIQRFDNSNYSYIKFLFTRIWDNLVTVLSMIRNWITWFTRTDAFDSD